MTLCADYAYSGCGFFFTLPGVFRYHTFFQESNYWPPEFVFGVGYGLGCFFHTFFFRVWVWVVWMVALFVCEVTSGVIRGRYGAYRVRCLERIFLGSFGARKIMPLQ